MNVIDSAHATVREYPGGSEALAPRMGMSGAVLRNKVNPHNTTHHLSLQEALTMMVLTHDHRVFHAMAAELGYTVTPVAHASDSVGAGDVLGLVLSGLSAEGDFAAAVRDALADAVITPNELLAIACSSDRVQRVRDMLLRKLQAMTHAAPPLREVA